MRYIFSQRSRIALFRTLVQLFSILVALVVIYSEYITYSILPYQWLEKPSCLPPKCYKLLMVADPQIISSQVSGKYLSSFIERWDSDRYIRETFVQALHFMKPDFIIFLGDLMDEGRISSNEDFLIDLERFYQIFELPKEMSNVQKIIIPGDNDIGGGEEDIMLPHVVARFDKTFNQSKGPVLHDHIEFYKVNFLSYSVQEPQNIDEKDSNIRVLLSHVPILPRVGHFVQSVAKKVKPHLIFSGHSHTSTHAVASESNIWQRHYIMLGPDLKDIKMFSLRRGIIHEITVPTCSYRMGVKDMGYGAAFINVEDKLLYYYVLWLPRRFTHLFNYLYILCVLVLFTFALVIRYLMYITPRLLRSCFSRTVTSNTCEP